MKSQEQTYVMIHGHRHRIGMWHAMQAGKSRWAELRCIFCNRIMDRRSHAPTTQAVDLMRYCSIGWLARLYIAAECEPKSKLGEPNGAAQYLHDQFGIGEPQPATE
jgi:hypothetical protein